VTPVAKVHRQTAEAWLVDAIHKCAPNRLKQIAAIRRSGKLVEQVNAENLTARFGLSDFHRLLIAGFRGTADAALATLCRQSTAFSVLCSPLRRAADAGK
jgi:hypothetical protein